MIEADSFYKEKVGKIFKEKDQVIDIGGSLRLLSGRGDKSTSQYEWLRPLVKKVDYKIMDVVSDYNPHIVGDIHDMPFEDNSIDAMLCISILEHVEDPTQAARELHRVLKPGGYCFVYVPFLYFYHAEKGYYGDYWRFTKDIIPILFKDFKTCEIKSVRGAIATWIHISPLARFPFIGRIAMKLDVLFGKRESAQASGYNIFLVK